MKNTFKVGDIVCLKTTKDVCEVGQTCDKKIYKGSRFKVLLVVDKATTHKGQESGLIVNLLNSLPVYPYVWDFNRFVKVN